MSAPIRADRIARYLELITKDNADATLSELCQRIADAEPLSEICRAWDVPQGRLMEWLIADEGRYGKYLKAKEIAAHQLIDETVEISDNKDDDDPADVARRKLRIDTRWRVAAAHAKHLYGTKETSGGGITVIVNRAGTDPPAPASATGIEVSQDGRKLTVEA